LGDQTRRRRGRWGGRGGDVGGARWRFRRRRGWGGLGVDRRAAFAEHAKAERRRLARHPFAAAAHRHRNEAEAGGQRAQAGQVQRRGVRKIGEIDQQRGAVEQCRCLRHPRRKTAVDGAQIRAEWFEHGQRDQAAFEAKSGGFGHAWW
jgi:hypothetical protein